jgi:hypothetical protein
VWDELDQVFAAHVRQETLEYAAREMADLASASPELRTTFDDALAYGLRRAEVGDARSCQSVETSGYYAKTPTDAADLIRALQALFARECLALNVPNGS